MFRNERESEKIEFFKKIEGERENFKNKILILEEKLRETEKKKS
jgi:hypothetical protein